MTLRIFLISGFFFALVLVPFALWGESFTLFFETLLEGSSPHFFVGAVIIVLLALDSILPTPSSIVSAVTALYFGFYIGFILIFFGMTLGVAVGYFIGSRLNQFPQIKHLLKERDVAVLGQLSERYGGVTLSIVRPIPVLAEVSVMLAGVSKMSIKRLILFTIPANAVISLVYSFISFTGGL